MGNKVILFLTFTHIFFMPGLKPCSLSVGSVNVPFVRHTYVTLCVPPKKSIYVAEIIRKSDNTRYYVDSNSIVFFVYISHITGFTSEFKYPGDC